MRRSLILMVTASAILVLQQPTAAGGGGWWTNLDLDGRYLGQGESFTARIREILYASTDEAKRAEKTAYYAYLVKDFDRRLLRRGMSQPDPKRWWRPLSPPIKVGVVELGARDANLARGRVHFDVPRVPLGRYVLMLCDQGCRTPLGNHIPVAVTITSDALAARTERGLEKTNERLDLAVARLRHDISQTRRQLRAAETDVTKALEAPARPQPVTVADPSPTTPPWIAYAGWFIAGALSALVLVRRREKGTLPDPVIERVPDDARELTKMR